MCRLLLLFVEEEDEKDEKDEDLISFLTQVFTLAKT